MIEPAGAGVQGGPGCRPIRSTTSRCCATGARSTSASTSFRTRSSTRSSCSRSRRTRRRRRRAEGLEVTAAHDARSVYEFSVFDDPATIDGCASLHRDRREGPLRPGAAAQARDHRRAIVMFGMEDPVAGASEQTMMVVDHPSLARRSQDRIHLALGAGADVRRGERGARSPGNRNGLMAVSSDFSWISRRKLPEISSCHPC